MAFLPSMMDLSSSPSRWSLSPMRQMLNLWRKISSAESLFMEPDLSSEQSALSSASVHSPSAESAPEAPSAVSVPVLSCASSPPALDFSSARNSSNTPISFPTPPSSFFSSCIGGSPIAEGSPAGVAATGSSMPAPSFSSGIASEPVPPSPAVAGAASSAGFAPALY